MLIFSQLFLFINLIVSTKGLEIFLSPNEHNHPIVQGSYTESHLKVLQNKTRALFDHGWNSYLDNAYPADELRPLTCDKYERVPDLNDIHRNDVLGNYSVTFLDTLTTFAVMGDIEKFQLYINEVRKITFDVDSVVQVFETAIRALGSLLSSHLYASDKFRLENYDGFLLEKAKDLGYRLLGAYNLETSIPYARINLQHGIKDLPQKLIWETCTAGAASPMLELTLLSVLTNDPIFENYSRATFERIWRSRSELDLLPMTLDPIKGLWLDSITGVGASIDSFYEYALKGSILFDDDKLFDIWKKSISALSTHSKVAWFYTNVNVGTGLMVSPWIDSLSAFFPGLLVLAGRLDDAISAHLPFLKLWNKYGGIPERWDFLSNSKGGFCTGKQDPISLEWYPLRPEFIESTYYLYRATKDPIYLRIGEKILDDFTNVFKVDCGFSGFRDIRTSKMQNRMESFVLSETLMYLYLLFDETNELNHRENFVFSTEGHPFWIPRGVLKEYKRNKIVWEKEVYEDKNHLEINETNPTLTEITKDTLIDLVRRIKEWPKEEIQNILEFVTGIFGNFSEEKALPLLIDGVSLMENGIDLRVFDDETCSVPPPPNFFSTLLQNPEFFVIDAKFQEQWDFSIEGSIETNEGFYSTYGDDNSYCTREPNVVIMDIIIGELTNIRTNHVHVIYGNTSLTNQNDLWVNSINGLRLKLELLKLGSIDSKNRFINKQFLSTHLRPIEYDTDGICLLGDEMFSNSVLQIQTINGISVEKDATIYFPRAELKSGLMNTKSVKITRDGFLVLDNVVVCNMRLWHEMSSTS